MEQLSGVMIIIIIGGGVLTFVMLFIFAKRQIMRFTLRSRRGPHMPIGNDAKKALRKEIERRLDCIQKIVQEPKLLWTDDKYILQPDKTLAPYHYRMQAVDDVKILEQEIFKSDGSARHPYDSLRAFLLTTLSATLNVASQRTIHQFCDMYEHARHDPNEFGSDEYESFHCMLLKLIEAAKQLRSFNSRKTSPARTPKKTNKIPSLLDPSRLKPPPATMSGRLTTCHLQPSNDLTPGQHSKVNLTLGLQGRDSLDSCEIVTNPLHLQTPAERDIIIRNRIKTPTLDDIPVREEEDDTNIEADDEEIISVSSVQFNCMKPSSRV
ncbi:protein C1orf43 homolog [Glossina fuscipes fuscipes]